MSSLPPSVVEDAKQIATSVEKTREKHKVQDASVMRQHACFKLATKLIQVAKNSKMDEDTLRTYLNSLRQNYISEIEKANSVN